jgi:hypothetical protein
MSTYNLNPELAKEGSGRASNRITDTGAYVGVITVAKDVKAGTGTTGIELSFKSNDGLEAHYLTLWTKNANGESIFGEKQLHALMTCLKVKSITGKDAIIEEYDFDARQNVKRQATVYPELMNKPVGLVLQREEYEGPNGIKNKMVFFAPFEAATRKTAAEILDQKPAEQLDKILKSLKDKTLKAGSRTTRTDEQIDADFDDSEIPF